MKKKKLKLFSILFSAITMVNNVFPTFAYDVDTEDNSIESTEYQNNEDIDFENSSNVFAQLGSEYKVTIPKVVVLSGASKDAKYFVKVEGDIAGYEQVTVIPEETFLLNSKNKDSQTATITQDKTIWSVNDFNTDAKGTISAEDITAGTWEGNFDFNINLAKVAGDIEEPKLLLNTTNLSMGVGKSHQVQAFYEDKDVTKEVDWSSDNEKFIVIDGLVMTSATAQVGDSATITATLDKDLSARNFLESSGLVLTAFAEDKALVASFNVTVVGIEVKDKDENIVNSVSVNPGKSVTLTASIIPETNDTVSWHATAPAGVLLIKNGNKADIYVAKDMPINNAYYIVVTYGDYAKTIILNVVPEIHTHINGEEIEENRIEPTCEKDGSYDKVVYCSTCGEEISRTTITTDKLGHDVGNLEITEEPTCEKDGKKEQKCNRCNKVVNTEIIDSLGHDYVEGVCTRCGSKLSDLVINASGYEGIFDNKEHSINVVSEGSTIEYSLDNENFDSVNPSFTDAGEYTVYYKVSKEGFKTVTGSSKVVINKIVTNLTTIPTAKTDLTYTGAAQELINKGTASSGTIQYRINDGLYETTIPTATNIGTYTIYYKVVGDSNHTDIEENSFAVEIKKAKATVTAPSVKTLAYNGTPQQLINAGTATNGTIKYRLENGEYDTAIPTAIDAGEYTIYYKVFGNDNYEDTKEQTITAIIKKAPSNITAPTAKTKLRCDGSEQVLVNAGSSTTGTIQYKIDNGNYSTELPKVTKGGTYKIYYKVFGNKNYEDTKEQVITITLAHTPDAVVIENEKNATCKDNGSYDKVTYCTICGKEMSRETVATKTIEHTKADAVEEIVKEPTCTSSGSCDKVVYCAVCHKELSRIREDIKPLGHNYVNDKCTRCGQLYIAGLYDDNGNLIKTWDELVALGIDPKTCANGATVLNNNRLSGKLLISNNVTSIANTAFIGCTNLKGVEIPGSVKTIGYASFENCTSLTSLVLNAGTETISQEAFYNTRMNELVIPETVKTIGSYAFYSNIYIKSLYIPNSVTSVGGEAFSYCTNLKHVTVGKIISTDNLRMFSNNTGNIEDAIVLDGVTRIGTCAFIGLGKLNKITLPDSITSIGYAAFENCTALTTVNSSNTGDCILPNQLISLEQEAFYNTRFTKVTIPDSTTTIGPYAFYSNINMNTIYIPNSVKSIGGEAFSYCTNLRHVTVGKIISTDNLRMFSNNANNIEDVTVLNGVTRIGTCAFIGLGKLYKITLPDTITSIGYAAFENCTALTTLNSNIGGECNLPYKVTSLEQEAFYNTRFTKVTIPDSTTTIGPYAFYSNINMNSVYIPNSVTSVGGEAFSYCTGLKYVTIGKVIGTDNLRMFCNNTSVENVIVLDGTTRIGTCAFIGLGKLCKVTLPDSITSIGYAAFENCTALTTISSNSIGKCFLPSELTTIEQEAFYNTRFVNVSMNKKVKTIGPYAFYSNVNMNYILIPNVETIGAYAFAYCTVLDNLLLPDSVSSVGEKAFDQCLGLKHLTTGKIISTDNLQMFATASNLEDVTITSGVTRIGTCAFIGLSKLYKATLPDSIISIGYAAFENCTALTTINSSTAGDCKIPKNVTSLEQEAFYNTRFTNVVIPNSTKTIGPQAFYSNVNMNTLYIPNSVTSVGGEAFSYCTGLKHVTVGKVIGTDNLRMFSNNTGNIEDVTVLSGATRIGTCAFIGLGKLNKITLPDSITSIGYAAFENCTALTTLNSTKIGECNIPKNITSLEQESFYNTRFTNVTIPDGVKTIGPYAFYSNINMKSISVPDSVTSVGAYAFAYCSSLSEITIPKNASVGANAFLSTPAKVNYK